MPTIEQASVQVAEFPYRFASPFGNDGIVPLYSSVPLNSPESGCLPCVVCGNSVVRNQVIASASQSNNGANGVNGTAGSGTKVVITPEAPPPTTRVLVVGGGGAAYDPGWSGFCPGGGGGGQVVESLDVPLSSGAIYQAYVGRGGINYLNEHNVPYICGETSRFGIAGGLPLLIAAGGQGGGSGGDGPANPPTNPYTGGGGGVYPVYPSTTGTSGFSGGDADSVFDNTVPFQVFVSGGGAGAAESGKSGYIDIQTVQGATTVFVGGPDHYTGGPQGGAGVKSLILNQHFGGGGGGTYHCHVPGSWAIDAHAGAGGLGGGGAGYASYVHGDPIPSVCIPAPNSGGGAGACGYNNPPNVPGADGVVVIQIPHLQFTGEVTGQHTQTVAFDNFGNRYVQLTFTGTGTYTA